MNIPTETQPVMLKLQKKYTNHNTYWMTYCNRLSLSCNVSDIYARNAKKTYHKF